MSTRSLIILIVLCLIVIPSAVRTLGFFSAEIWRLQQSIGGDKVVHFMFGSLLMGCFAFLCRSSSSSRELIFMFFLAFLILMLEETLQFLTPGRHFEWIDMFWSLLGVCTVFISSFLLKHLKKN